MSSHCGRYPVCGCSKEMGSKCHLPADHPKLHENDERMIVSIDSGGNGQSVISIDMADEMNDLRRSVHIMENNAVQIAKSNGSKFTPAKKKRRK